MLLVKAVSRLLISAPRLPEAVVKLEDKLVILWASAADAVAIAVWLSVIPVANVLEFEVKLEDKLVIL